jgi:hypothetical protein
MLDWEYVRATPPVRRLHDPVLLITSMSFIGQHARRRSRKFVTPQGLDGSRLYIFF